jgi:hypothetical protein
MEIIDPKRWPEYASNQVELLIISGMSRSIAEAYYRPTLSPDAVR